MFFLCSFFANTRTWSVYLVKGQTVNMMCKDFIPQMNQVPHLHPTHPPIWAMVWFMIWVASSLRSLTHRLHTPTNSFPLFCIYSSCWLFIPLVLLFWFPAQLIQSKVLFYSTCSTNIWHTFFVNNAQNSNILKQLSFTEHGYYCSAVKIWWYLSIVSKLYWLKNC